MIRRIIHIVIMSFLALQPVRGNLHVYLVYYATINGETGHTGIAIDNYKIVVNERMGKDITTFRYDSVRTGSLTYYDLWPREDYYDKKLIAVDQQPLYCKLPRASWEPDITLSSLLLKGIPQYNTPVDGLVQITTTPGHDWIIRAFLDSILSVKRPFNALHYTCTDFAEQVIEFVTGEDIKAKEFVWAGWCTTPNKLYRKVARLKGTKIIKDPENVVYRSFLVERIIKREVVRIRKSYSQKKQPTVNL